MTSLKANGRIWISVDGVPLIGAGKTELIIKIKELGSLRKAALEMKMSYRKAWYSIDQINKLAGQPVIVLQRGGKNGGEAILTEFGKNLIEKYQNLQSDFDSFLNEKSNTLQF
jgi:molybdate transport system regulatory protein